MNTSDGNRSTRSPRNGRAGRRSKGRERHHNGGHRNRMGRFFAHGDLRYLILHLIAEKPRHGYEIIKEIEAGVMGRYSPSPGVIYPTLTLLEEQDWAQVSDSTGNKKLYDITATGVHALEANQAVVKSILARMAEVREAEVSEEGSDNRKAETSVPPRARRALDELSTAIEDRFATSPVPRERAAAIVQALSTAIETVKHA